MKTRWACFQMSMDDVRSHGERNADGLEPRLHRIVAAQPYPVLFVMISRLRQELRRAEDGAHLCGFPSPDSDYDLRVAHVLPLDAVVGLEVRDETVQQEMIVPPDTSSGLRPPSPQSGE